jgi:acyl carrier protein phosphodiesterase
MNFLAHLYLARDDEGLMLGGLLGDFVRGLRALSNYPPEVQSGIRLHRKIDRFTDQTADVKALRRLFPAEFRRYSGIIIDLAFDHELAKRWPEYSDQSLEDFDLEVRALLSRNVEMQPEGLQRFISYADRRGLFATYRFEDEMLLSLSGIGNRMRRSNPLHRVAEIWPDVKADCAEGFEQAFPTIQGMVADWRKRRSTTTGS